MTDAFAADARQPAITVEIAEVALRLRDIGLAILSLGIATSSLTFNWVIEHNAGANFFPEFAGRVVYLSDILLLAGVAVWVGGWSLLPRQRLDLGPRYLFLPLLVVVILTALSTIWAGDPAQAGYATTRRLVLFSAYVVLVNDARRALTPLVIALFLIGMLHVAVEWAQVIQGSSVGLASLGEVELVVGMDIGCPRAIGLGFNPNPVGLFLAIVNAVAYGLFLLGNGGRFRRALLLVPFEITFFGLLATLSRSAMVGWCLGVLAVTLLAWRWNREQRTSTVRRHLVAAAMAAAAVWLLPTVFPLTPKCGPRPNRYSNVEVSNATVGRLVDLRLAVPIIKDNPWLGVGASNYPLALRKQIPRIYTPVHNVPVLLAAELGIPGFLSWLLIMFAPVIWTYVRWRTDRVDLHELLWLAPLLVLLFVGLLDFTPWATQDGRVLLMAVLGLWAGGVTLADASTSGRHDRGRVVTVGPLDRGNR